MLTSNKIVETPVTIIHFSVAYLGIQIDRTQNMIYSIESGEGQVLHSNPFLPEVVSLVILRNPHHQYNPY